ncbi:glycoside hydrolase family 31 protein [Flavivirga algicola]|uniref:Glycoside hydrolase family 31 protein n=1 Tax=Flavivirga algicola TaxID=2729136 RepID=A0ABX1RWL7_9FLAO|nr:TIM-barrel domain-containing protein [Flavivirga algicola]NMH87961.1 glycoside hydrolase family 31 protein [Flavivirga algicola]
MKKQLLLFAFSLFLIFGIKGFSQNQLGKVVSYKKDQKAVLFQCEHAKKVKLSIITDAIFRVQVAPNGTFKKSKTIEFGFVKDDFPATNFNLNETEKHYQITTSKLDISVDKEAFRIEVKDKEGNIILRENKKLGTQTGSKNALNFDMPADEHFFGFGFMRETLDARGHKLTFKRAYRWKGATLPYFMSTRGYAFYSNSVYNQDFDFSSKSGDVSNDYYSITSNGGAIDYYIIYGPDFPNLLNRYTDLTGKSMMVPKWAFGLEYRLRYYGNQKELLDIAKEFREKEIPADIVALEPGWEDVAYSMKWKWSPERFPNPEKMIAELGDMGFKMDLWESGVAPVINISKPKTRKNWYKKRKHIVNMGVRMFKQDDPYPRSITSSELLDPTYGVKPHNDKNFSEEEMNNISNSLYSETLFEEFRKQTKERAIVMFHAYNASVASHRWPFQWAGDFQAENGMLNASLSGHAMVSYDIRNPYAAGWHQGFFTPFTVVDAWAYYREPWLYSESIEQSHRVYACLRSRLVPYLYSSLWQSRKVGLPIERPMVLNYHDDPITHHMKSQFMVGDWFLLALSDVDDSPAGEKIDFWTGVQKGNHGRAYLPKGKWINYWNGNVENIEKSQWVNGDWPEYLGGLLFVKAGAIIPMGQTKNYIGETKDEVVVLDIYPHEKSSFQLYEDDGISYDYEKGTFTLTDITSDALENEVKISISKRKGSYNNMPEKRTYLVKMHSLLKPNNIYVDGYELAYFDNQKDLIHDIKQNGWFYDAIAKKAVIKLDKGWQYAKTTDGSNPIATIPLTAKNERIVFSDAYKNQSGSRNILVKLPKLAVVELNSNIKSLPSDGYSLAKIKVHLLNEKSKVQKIDLKIEGPASFQNGTSSMSFNPTEQDYFNILAGKVPGTAKISISGTNIEKGSFSLPIYGNPVRLEIEKANTVLVADNENTLEFTAKLFDDGNREVLTTGSPIIVHVEGEALCENESKKQSIYFKDGSAKFSLKSTNTPGDVKVSVTFANLKEKTIRTTSKKGALQVRINPPEKVKLDSDGGWIPDNVDVFVNFRAGDKLIRNIEKEVILNVYNKQGKLLQTYTQVAKKGEVIFKDISYYKRPAQCLFEIKCEGYETVTRKVFENTWDAQATNSKKKKGGH